jgi:hypothetical protein
MTRISIVAALVATIGTGIAATALGHSSSAQERLPKTQLESSNIQHHSAPVGIVKTYLTALSRANS